MSRGLAFNAVRREVLVKQCQSNGTTLLTDVSHLYCNLSTFPPGNSF